MMLSVANSMSEGKSIRTSAFFDFNHRMNRWIHTTALFNWYQLEYLLDKLVRASLYGTAGSNAVANIDSTPLTSGCVAELKFLRTFLPAGLITL